MFANRQLTLSNDNEDVAFVYETSKMLNFYSSIPWAHFDKNRAAYMATSMDTWLRNNYSITSVVTDMIFTIMRII